VLSGRQNAVREGLQNERNAKETVPLPGPEGSQMLPSEQQHNGVNAVEGEPFAHAAVARTGAGGGCGIGRGGAAW